MVELALVLPILLVLLFGIIEFGLLLFNQQVITNASREGARFGIVMANPRMTSDQISAVVTSYCGDHLVTFANSKPAPTIAVDNSGGTSFGDDLEVSVTYPYQFLVLPNFVTSLTGTRTLSARTVMKYE